VKTILRLLHCAAMVCAVLMIGLSTFEWFQLNGFHVLELSALGKYAQLGIGLALGSLVLWESANHKSTSLKTIIIVHLIWSFVFFAFFLSQYRIVPELYGFKPEDYSREYLKGITRLIVSCVFWIGIFSIGPMLKAWDIRHESRR
jgi:hypothetical protein